MLVPQARNVDNRFGLRTVPVLFAQTSTEERIQTHPDPKEDNTGLK